MHFPCSLYFRKLQTLQKICADFTTEALSRQAIKYHQIKALNNSMNVNSNKILELVFFCLKAGGMGDIIKYNIKVVSFLK